MADRRRPLLWSIAAHTAVNLAKYALIPSLLVWTVVLLAVSGDLGGALQVMCASIAAGFVGWSLGSEGDGR